MLESNIPILNVSVMEQAFPQGPEACSTVVRQDLYQDYQTWRDIRDEYLDILRASSPGDVEKACEAARKKTRIDLFHEHWIGLILNDLLGWPEKCVVDASIRWPDLVAARFPKACSVKLVTHKGTAKLLFSSFAPEADYLQKSGRVLSPAEELAQFMRDHEDAPRVALMTDGERWTLITALTDNPDAFASWYASDWRREALLLKSFSTLLSFRRICASKDSLMDLLERTVKDQENVTDTLGEQVQRAIEVLIQSLDKADAGSEHALLKGIDAKTLYDASLTVMMRLVFILCAEERHLLPLGDPLYDDNYALSILRERLRNDVDAVLERRYDAWVRFLALCRMIHQGVSHPNLRMPALGGSIFDPDRYPFFEGRSDTNSQGRPLPIDNRTFLYLLEALQVIEHPTGAEIVSYGSLDVEQIGHIYEGLLELKVEHAPNVTLRLNASKNAPSPEQELAKLESLSFDGQTDLINHLADATKITKGKLKKLLDEKPTLEQEAQLHGVCGDPELAKRVLPFINLIKLDAWDRPIVYHAGAIMVTTGASRRDTGSYYTPRQLTERVVKTTLEPLVYAGPSEGREKVDWKLKTPEELLKLKICDPTMGSGAFLVQTCRYLSQRLLEAWAEAEARGKVITIDGEVVDALGAIEPMPKKVDARLVEAKRLVAERCLYGVDKNPMAVELAKLSIWLVTLAKGRPFAFLDHCLGCGDSLLGIYRRKDLNAIAGAAGMFGESFEQIIDAVLELRRKIRYAAIRDIRDVKLQQAQLRSAKNKLNAIELIADVLLLSQISKAKTLDLFCDKNIKKARLLTPEQILANVFPSVIESDENIISKLEQQRGQLWENIDNHTIDTYAPFHWALVFPEISEQNGFDAIVGNPPFIGNAQWKSVLGNCSYTIAKFIIGDKFGKIDISVVFNRRIFDLIRLDGYFGLISTTNVSEGISVNVGLGSICKKGKIYSAIKSMRWPGSANINVSLIHVFKGNWKGKLLLNERIVNDPINGKLHSGTLHSYKEIQNQLVCSAGINSAHIDDVLLTKGDEFYSKVLSENPSVIVGIVNGQEINTTSLNDITKFSVDARDRTIVEIKKLSRNAYEFLLSRKEARMKSIGDESTYRGWKSRWWQHWNSRANFLNKYEKKPFLGLCKLTKYPVPRKLEKYIGTDKTLMIPLTEAYIHSICLSSFFRVWVSRFNGAKQGADKSSISLNVADISAFPLPLKKPVDINGSAQAFDNYLRDMNGVTPAMNAICDEQNQAPNVVEARKLIREIDALVLKVYDWDDLALQYEYQDEGIGPRYMLTKELREEILDRLIKLNHQYWEEQNQPSDKKEVK